MQFKSYEIRPTRGHNSQLRNHALTNRFRAFSISPKWATTEKVNWCVVHKVPNAFADDTICTLVGFRCLDNFLLHCTRRAPHAHETRVFLPIRPSHEACIIWSQGSGEHTCAPRPMHVFHFPH